MRLESSGSATGLAALPFASVCDLVPDTCQHGGGGLDEAVFDQINQLGLGNLDCMDDQLMSSLHSSDSQLQEDVDSDSGLSLESSSGGPVSPGGCAFHSSSHFIRTIEAKKKSINYPILISDIYPKSTKKLNLRSMMNTF